MKAPLFDDILNISQQIADASGNENEAAREEAYKALIKLCAANDNSPKDHPLQWEALADFTLDADQAIDIYEKGILCADKLSLIDSKASMLLAMAIRFDEMEESEKSTETAAQLAETVESINNAELKAEVLDYLKS